MKTTIDLDEEKLKRLMRLTGIKTRKEAIDYALTEAERLARLDQFFEHEFYVVKEGPIIDPDYDVFTLRKLDKPARRS